MRKGVGIRMLRDELTRGRGLRGELLRGATGSLVLKIASAGLLFVGAVVLARILGPRGYGTYVYAISIAGLLYIPASLGLPQLAIREVSVYDTRSDFGRMRGLLRWSNAAVAALSVAAAAGAAAVAGAALEGDRRLAVLVALGSVPLVALGLLRSGVLRGLRRVIVAQVPEALLRPGGLVVLAVAAWLWLGDDFGPSWAAGAHVAASAVALAVGTVLVLRALPRACRGADPVYTPRPWLAAGLPMLAVGAMQVVNQRLDVVMVGSIAGSEEAGVYAVASRGAELVTFVLAAGNMALQPVFASLHAEGARERLQRVVTLAARAMLALSVPVAVVLVVWGEPLIRFVFGAEFAPGATALAILAGAQLVNVAAGPVGTMLMMTAYERTTAVGVGVGTAVNVTLNAVLIPVWGIEGAAVATGTSLLVWNAILVWRSLRTLRVDPTALGIRRAPR